MTTTSSSLLRQPIASCFTRLLGALALAGALAGCASSPTGKTAVRLDDTSRIAVISAFAPELTVLLPQVQQPAKHSINGVEFTTGTLEGKPVVVFLSGISMTNAAMNTQLVLDRFNVSHVVFSGIAGGVNPGLHIGDVTVPAQWGQYMEWLMAREDKPGQYSAPAWMKSELTMPAFGMMHPRPVGRGYVHLRETGKSPWPHATAASGEPIRAHEFHYSSVENLPYDTVFAYTVERGHGVDGRHDGIVHRNVLASYTHLRSVAGNPWAPRFVDFIRERRNAG